MQYQPSLEKRKSLPAEKVSVTDSLGQVRSGAGSGQKFQWQDLFWPVLIVFLALCYSFATGPFRAPDEPHHFFRAYEISEGRLIAALPGGGFVGDWLPHSLDKTALILGGYPFVPEMHVDRAAMARAWAVKLKSHRGFVPFPGAALHSPLVYLPAAAGISLGKAMHARPLILFYLARCGNALVAGGLIGLALRRLWRSAPYVATIALFPMCLFQVGNLTSDAVTFGICFFWFSEILSARQQSCPKGTPIRWILLALVLSQLRFPYPLLGLLVLAIPRPLTGETKAARWRFFALFFGALILPCLLWISVVQGLRVQLRPNVAVDPGAQLQFIASQPLAFLGIFYGSLREFGYEFWRQMIGVLGWLNLSLPIWIPAGVTTCLLITICSSDTATVRLTKVLRSAWLILALTALFLTAVVVYLAWNQVAAPRIEGWQGRYVIPILPLLASALASAWLRQFRWLAYAALTFSCLANVASIFYLVRATWL
ncbi:MAG: DUF2142 domain-containing protein [Chthoniobacterales bacterium]